MSTPLLSVLPPSGEVRRDLLPELPAAQLVALYAGMLRTRILDTRMLALQRQGRIGFYGTCMGQEAATIGSGAAVGADDWVFPALREGAVLIQRGFPLEQYVAQLMGCSLDATHGRQMPCHFSSAEHRFVSLSSPIGTQITQGMGAAWAAKLRGDKCVVLVYFGDGATSEPDFHAALTFAAVHKVPAIFFCQNNQFAISVPFCKQTASDGIAIKAVAYGLPGVAVDGNDVLAVYAATAEAVARARSGGGPTLIEAVTYRLAGHSSSDDPGRYRDEAVTEEWRRKDPIDRFRRYLQAEGLVDEAVEESIRAELKAAIDAAIILAEATPPPDPSTLFDDVYKSRPRHLQEQRAQLAAEQSGGTAEGAFPL